VVTGIGAATAVYAATMALTEDDIKRVLAYSTISQLGYMFIGVGLGTLYRSPEAYTTGLFTSSPTPSSRRSSSLPPAP